MTHKVDIVMIKDAANPILPQKVHPPTSFGMAHFKGLFVPTHLSERLEKSINIEMGGHRFDPMNTNSGNGAIGTSAPASTSTSAPVGATTLLPRSTTTRFVSVTHEFLQQMVE